MQKRFVAALALCAASLVMFFNCNEKSPAAPAAPTVVSTWKLQVPDLFLPQLNDTVDHAFTLTLMSDQSYTLNDMLTAHTSGMQIPQAIEEGDYTSSGATYTLVPTKCADPTTGQLSATACTVDSRTATESGTSLTVSDFFGGMPFTKQ
jgi:hypothetical protein